MAVAASCFTSPPSLPPPRCGDEGSMRSFAILYQSTSPLLSPPPPPPFAKFRKGTEMVNRYFLPSFSLLLKERGKGQDRMEI